MVSLMLRFVEDKSVCDWLVRLSLDADDLIARCGLRGLRNINELAPNLIHLQNVEWLSRAIVRMDFASEYQAEWCVYIFNIYATAIERNGSFVFQESLARKICQLYPENCVEAEKIQLLGMKCLQSAVILSRKRVHLIEEISQGQNPWMSPEEQCLEERIHCYLRLVAREVSETSPFMSTDAWLCDRRLVARLFDHLYRADPVKKKGLLELLVRIAGAKPQMMYEEFLEPHFVVLQQLVLEDSEICRPLVLDLFYKLSTNAESWRRKNCFPAPDRGRAFVTFLFRELDKKRLLILLFLSKHFRDSTSDFWEARSIPAIMFFVKVKADTKDFSILEAATELMKVVLSRTVLLQDVRCLLRNGFQDLLDKKGLSESRSHYCLDFVIRVLDSDNILSDASTVTWLVEEGLSIILGQIHPVSFLKQRGIDHLRNVLERLICASGVCTTDRVFILKKFLLVVKAAEVVRLESLWQLVDDARWAVALKNTVDTGNLLYPDDIVLSTYSLKRLKSVGGKAGCSDDLMLFKLWVLNEVVMRPLRESDVIDIVLRLLREQDVIDCGGVSEVINLLAAWDIESARSDNSEMLLRCLQTLACWEAQNYLQCLDVFTREAENKAWSLYVKTEHMLQPNTPQKRRLLWFLKELQSRPPPQSTGCLTS